MRRWQAVNRGQVFCQHRFGRHVCGTRLEHRIDRMLGRVIIHCPSCARWWARRCADCPARLPAKRCARRCAPCLARWEVTRHAGWYLRNRETIIEKQVVYQRARRAAMGRAAGALRTAA